MSTRTRTRRSGQATPTVTYRNKSDWARHMLDQGHKIKDIEKMSHDPATGSLGPMGYSFVFGVAKRAGLADEAADRRPTKSVTIDPGFVTIRCDTGDVVKVDRATGKVYRKKAKATA